MVGRLPQNLRGCPNVGAGLTDIFFDSRYLSQTRPYQLPNIVV